MATAYWAGGTNTSTNTAANWVDGADGTSAYGRVPNDTDDVIFQSLALSNVSNNPTLDAADTWNSMKVDSGCTLTAAGFKITVDGELSGRAIYLAGTVSGILDLEIQTQDTTIVNTGSKCRNITINHADCVAKWEGDSTFTGITVTAGKFEPEAPANDELTASGDVSVTGTLGIATWDEAASFNSLTIADGGTYIATSGTTTIDGESGATGYAWNNLETDGTGFVHNNGTVSGFGTSTHLKEDAFYNLTIAMGQDDRKSDWQDADGNNTLTVFGDLNISQGEFGFTTADDALVVHGNTVCTANGTFGEAAGSMVAPTGVHTFHGLVTNSGQWNTSSGTNNYNGGIRQLNGTVGASGFLSDDTLTIGGTGAVLEGNLDDAIINVNQDAVYYFDGVNDRIDCGRNTSMNVGTGDFTLSAWVKTTHNQQQVIMANGGDKRYTMFLQGDGKLNTEIDDDTTKTMDVSTSAVNDGSWHHVCLTVDRSADMQWYIDGSTDGAGASITGTPLTLDDNSYDMNIGQWSSDEASVDWFEGNIADVRVYSDVLTVGEVQTLASKINIDTALGPSTANLLFHLPIAGTSIDLTDNSANSNNGTASGSPATVYDAFSVAVQDATTTTDGAVTVTQGKLEGLALSQLHFDGTDDIVNVTSVDPVIPADFTVSCWFNADVVEGDVVLVGNGTGSVSYTDPTQGWNMNIRDNSASALSFSMESEVLNFANLPAALSAGRWYHYVVAVNGAAPTNATLDCYVDGAFHDQQTASSPMPARTSDLYIGGHGVNTTAPFNHFDGKIRDVRIYEGTLSADQVASLYSGSYNVTPKYWWKMDDGSGTAVEDYGTATDADGTAANFAMSGGASSDWVNGTLDLDSTLTIAANGTFNGPRGTLALDGDVTGAGAFTLLTGSTFTFAANKTFTGTSSSSQLTVDIPADLDLELVADIANVHCKSGTDITIVGAVTGCTFEDSTANIRQWHHTLDTQQLLDADEAGDDDLKLERPALDNALELMTG